MPIKKAIDVFCVYGPSYLRSVTQTLIPALERQVGVAISLHVVNYSSTEALLDRSDARIEVRDWSSRRAIGRMGFGQGINFLFQCVKPSPMFVVANPDTAPVCHAIETLSATLSKRLAGIVEARQWPAEHPKEFEAATLQTPWATGAFFAASSAAFQSVCGFDESFFMYNEDVDLSWRMRLAGWDILYQPDSLVYHYTGAGKYQTNVFYFEHFYSLRNFIALAYKFWGGAGERIAREQLDRSGLPSGFIKCVGASYDRLKPRIARVPGFPPNRWIKIQGLNRYHDLRAV